MKNRKLQMENYLESMGLSSQEYKISPFILIAIIFFIFLPLLADDYITYTETFTHLGPDGDDPESVFADLISRDELNAVKGYDERFYFDGHKWINEIGKIRNGILYTIQIKENLAERRDTRAKQMPNREPTMIIVNINGTGNYTTVQEGIDNSVNGDTVLVYPGTYFENINYNGKNITLASLYLTTQADSFINRTIIDGNRDGSVVTFENGEDTTAVLCGFTIQNGSGTYL